MNAQRLSQDLIVTGFGIITSFAVAYGLSTLEVLYGVSLYSVMFFLIVPVVAILAGFLAASGYYFGSLLFQHRPSKAIKVNMVLVSIVTFLLIHLLTYNGLEVNGARLKDQISFFGYIHEHYTHTSLRFGKGGRNMVETGELGLLGYGLAALQIVGFAGGGSWIFLVLSGRPYCESCGRYLKKKGRQTRYATDRQAFAAQTGGLMALIESGRVQEALEAHATFGPPKLRRRRSMRSTLDVRKCPKCDQNWVRHKLEEIGDRWNEIASARREAFTDESLRLPGA